MSDRPLVSVVIPAVRGRGVLRHALESVVSQAYRPTEIVLVDTGPDSGAERAAAELGLPERALRLVREPGAGLMRAINAGLRASRGAYIGFLDCDDEWLPAKLDKQVPLLDSFADLGLVGCRAWQIDEDGGVSLEPRPRFKGIPTLRALVEEWPFIGSFSSVLIRRACLDQVGPLNEALGPAADYDLYLRIARRWRLAMVDEPLVRAHRHAASPSRNLPELWRRMLEVLASLQPSAEHRLTPAIIRRATDRYCGLVYGSAVSAQRDGQFRRAAQCFSAAVARDPLIGTRSPWKRVGNPVSRALGPYANLVRCRVMSVLSNSAERSTSVRSSKFEVRRGPLQSAETLRTPNFELRTLPPRASGGSPR